MRLPFFNLKFSYGLIHPIIPHINNPIKSSRYHLSKSLFLIFLHVWIKLIYIILEPIPTPKLSQVINKLLPLIDRQPDRWHIFIKPFLRLQIYLILLILILRLYTKDLIFFPSIQRFVICLYGGGLGIFVFIWIIVFEIIRILHKNT